MADVRVPRGYGRYQTPYLELMEGQRPSLDEQTEQPLKPAPWLPIAYLDEHHNDGVVIQAGTWVGRLNSTDHATPYTAPAAAWRHQWLVPAFQGTGEYSVTYGANDVTYEVPDVDNWPTAVASAGASTITVPQVKPVGVAYQDMYGSYYSLRWKNYERQSQVGFLAYGQVIMVPVMTSEEADIQPNDIVAVVRTTDASPTWNPTSVANKVGHLMPWDTNCTIEYKVGRCLEKVLIADGGGASQRLSAAVSASTATNVHNFGDLLKAQTVPGLGLQGSGTDGIPGFLLNAVAQGGNWYALLINVGAN